MQCFIYKSLKKDELYLYIKQKDDFSDIPETLLDSLGRLEFVMALELTPKRTLARADVNQVMQSLTEKGFFIQMPPTPVTANINLKNSPLH